MQQVSQRPDPAPSRLSYRYERLMLTPLFRFGVRVVLPFAATALITTVWFSDQDRRDNINMVIDDIRTSIVERPEFMVQAMSIEGASAGVGDDIREILPVDFPVSSFDLDLDAMKKTVDGLSPVKSATLRVKPGGVLQVIVEERTPVILWRMPDGLHLVDAEGFVVAEGTQRELHPNLPIMAGEGAEAATTEALRLLQAAGSLADRMRGLVRVGERRRLASSSRGAATACMVYEHATHRSRGGGEEVGAVLPVDSTDLPNPQEGLVHERGRLQGVTTRLLAEVSLRESAKLLVDHRKQVGGGVGSVRWIGFSSGHRSLRQLATMYTSPPPARPGGDSSDRSVHDE